MDENKDMDSKESGEYEDDFEKDLEWLINEKEKSHSVLGVSYTMWLHMEGTDFPLTVPRRCWWLF